MRYRHTMLLLYLSLPICVALRAIQMLFTIDSTTGFIKQQYTLISTLITLLICAAAVSIALLASATNGIKQPNESLKPGIAAAAVLTGGMFIYQSVAGISNLSVFAWHDVLLVFLSVLSAFSFIAYGLKNIYEYNMPTMIMIIPTLYYIVRLINIFINTSKLTLVTENIFLIFTNSALLLFMYELAGVENQVEGQEKRPKKLFAFGIAAIMLCVTTSLPKIVLIIFSENKVLNSDISHSMLNLSIAVFIFVYIMYNYSEKRAVTQKTQPKHLA